ncbi:n utilization substance protein B homolog [Corallococcus sp. CAG:1435]|uniref:Transcription antitermination factor NusB n=1 Tax=Candidatus Fimimonas gallinarum TaxID=2840821 RepID=A0A9D1E4R3_9BACT|nr:n utilization substance protein B homolog [Corallococcus sp. CAG:1435]HIR66264.1 transcription antitermination factor NusB [Candidatus Fimimonas gallinarum]
MRSYAREVAFCKVYSYLMSGDYDGDFSQFDADKLTEEDLTFADTLVKGVIGQKQSLDSVVAEFSRSFKLNRIYRPDLAALELALYEMKNCDTPHPVVINEAVDIAKKYSTEKSVSYVNGILAAYERSLKNE